MANQSYGGFDPQTFAAALQSADPKTLVDVYQQAVDPQMKMLIEMEFNRRQEAAGQSLASMRPPPPTYSQQQDQGAMPPGPVASGMGTAPPLPGPMQGAPQMNMGPPSPLPMQGIEGGFSFGMPAAKAKPKGKGRLSESDRLNMAELQRIRARKAGGKGLLMVTPTGPGLLAS